MIVTKFGGTSMASAEQFKKVKSIIDENPARQVVVVSAAGKKNSSDIKITDLLYTLHTHLVYGVPYDDIWGMNRQNQDQARSHMGARLFYSVPY